MLVCKHGLLVILFVGLRQTPSIGILKVPRFFMCVYYWGTTEKPENPQESREKYKKWMRYEEPALCCNHMRVAIIGGLWTQ